MEICRKSNIHTSLLETSELKANDTFRQINQFLLVKTNKTGTIKCWKGFRKREIPHILLLEMQIGRFQKKMCISGTPHWGHSMYTGKLT